MTKRKMTWEELQILSATGGNAISECVFARNNKCDLLIAKDKQMFIARAKHKATLFELDKIKNKIKRIKNICNKNFCSWGTQKTGFWTAQEILKLLE